jgi:hypothetical protein
MMPRQCGYQDDAHNPFCAGYDFAPGSSCTRDSHLGSLVAIVEGVLPAALRGGDNVLRGLAGHDLLMGLAGADTLLGGGGISMAVPAPTPRARGGGSLPTGSILTISSIGALQRRHAIFSRFWDQRDDTDLPRFFGPRLA